MAFPEDVIDSKVELFLGGAWTDITAPYVYGRDENGITITYGRPDEAGTVNASSCTFEVDNSDGRFSPKNPNSPYYGLLKKGTPVRVSVMHDLPYLKLDGTGDKSATPDNAALDITGDIDIRIDLSLDRWYDPTGSIDLWQEIIGKFRAVGNQRSWFLRTQGNLLTFEWSADGSSALSATATEAVHVPGSGRIAVRVTMDVNNGAAGRTITFYTARTLADGNLSGWNQLGDPVIQAGTTSIFNSTAPLEIGDATDFAIDDPSGKVYAAEVRNLIGGTAVANPDFTAQAPGTTSFTDAAGRTWTNASGATITNQDIRFQGNVASWPVRWQTGRKDVHVEVEASGPLRRLGQGQSPLHSAMFREFFNPTRQNIVAYWSMEDGSDATSFASAIPNAPAMLITGDVSPASFSEYGPSEALPTVENGVLAGTVPPYTVTGETNARMFFQLPSVPPAADRGLFILETTGTAAKWIAWWSTTNGLALRAYDRDYNEIFDSGFASARPDSVPLMIGIQLTQNGADVDWTLITFDCRGNALEAVPTNSFSGTLAGRTVLAVKRVRVGGNGDLSGLAVGHIAVANEIDAYAGTAAAMRGWRGELATTRFRRLMTEEGQRFTVAPGEAGIENNNYRMGNQGEGTLLGLARTCEAVSNGVLYEHRERPELVLRDGAGLYNQEPAVTLDFNGDDGLVVPLDPDLDDRFLVNDFTATRTSGSSYRVQKTEGANNLNDPEEDDEGVGPYESGADFDFFLDVQNEHFASWAVIQGTLDENRYSRVKILLQNATHMMPEVSAACVGDVLALDDLPAELVGPGQGRMLIQGYTEYIAQFQWEFTFNTSPAAGYYVGEEGASDYIRADTSGSTIVEALTTTETDVDVQTPMGMATWIDTDGFSSEFPFDVTAGGERMTVTACRSFVKDAFPRTTANGWGTPDQGVAWSIAGGTAADFSVGSGYGVHTLATVAASRRTFSAFTYPDFDVVVDVATSALATGSFLSGGPTARYIDADNLYQARLAFETTGAINLSLRRRLATVETDLGTSLTGLTHAAGTFYRVRFQGSGSTLQAKAWLVGTAEPTGWNVSVTDTGITTSALIGCRSISNTGNTNAASVQIRYDNFEITDTQVMTVTRSVEGIVKTHAAGTAISLHHPARAAL